MALPTVVYFYNEDTNTAYKRTVTDDSDKREVMFLDDDGKRVMHEVDTISKFAEWAYFDNDEDAWKQLESYA